MTPDDPPKPRRLDSVGHSVLRLIQRRPDVIESRGFENINDVTFSFLQALKTAELVNGYTFRRGVDGHLSTWRVFEDVLISVNRNGIVTTVHATKWVP